MNDYFVIFGSEDGGCSIRQMTHDEVLALFKPNEYGDYLRGCRALLKELPEDICNFTDMVIIKGKIVVPKTKTVVTEYELE